MTIETIKNSLTEIVKKYPICRIVLFGSRADETNRADSDVDLIVEFSAPITLLTLSMLRCDLEDLLGLPVDLIHGPIQPTDMIELGKVVELYAA
ncbi:MAG: nucleotidyltransferase family protein [Faecousia sp.]